MRYAVKKGLQDGCASVLLWGADAPTIPQPFFEQLVDSTMHSKTIALIPAQDGGFVAANLNHDPWPLFKGVDWGKASVLSKTLKAAKRDGWHTTQTDAWYDLDRIEDLPHLFNTQWHKYSQELAPKTYALAAEILKS